MTLNSLPAWPALQTHYDAIRDERLRDWFAPQNDTKPSRAERLTFEGGGISVDFSKNRITEATLKLLVELAQQAKVAEKRDAV
ncbi:MAG: glucose-6-phosphate isomerase, partial [Caballeronia mineralivorans]|nr:glucose-6-phosphate isomerase [Caballeronia mineralivorans]